MKMRTVRRRGRPAAGGGGDAASGGGARGAARAGRRGWAAAGGARRQAARVSGRGWAPAGRRAVADRTRHASVERTPDVSLIRDFKTFMFRGNVLDLAVAIVVGTAFTAVVKALVSDLLTPV